MGIEDRTFHTLSGGEQEKLFIVQMVDQLTYFYVEISKRIARYQDDPRSEDDFKHGVKGLYMRLVGKIDEYLMVNWEKYEAGKLNPFQASMIDDLIKQIDFMNDIKYMPHMFDIYRAFDLFEVLIRFCNEFGLTKTAVRQP